MSPLTRISARGVALGCILGTAMQVAQADVTIEESISIKGIGAMSMANMAGRTVTTISGDRARMESDLQLQSRVLRRFARGATGPSVEIVRLDEDKVYSLDPQRKQYTEQSLADTRAQLEKALAQGQQAGQQQPAPVPMDESQCEWSDPKAEVKRTGERATVAGFDAERVTVTASQACKQRSSDQVCEFALSLDQWLAPSVPGGDDALAFQQAYAQKMGLDASTSKDVAQRAKAMFGRYEGVWKELAGKMGEIEGYPVRSSFALAIGGPQCQGAKDAQAAAAQSPPSGADIGQATAEAAGQIAAEEAVERTGRSALGGIAGALGGRVASSILSRRRQQQEQEQEKAKGAGAEPPAAVTPAPAMGEAMVPFIMVTSEIVSVSNSPAQPGAFEIPADYKKTNGND